MEKILNKMYGTEPQFDLGRQAFHQSCFMSGFALLVGILMAARVGNVLFIAVLFFCLFILAVGYWLSRFQGKFTFAMVLFAVAAYSTIGSSFFLSQGIEGGTSVISLLALCLFYASSRSEIHWLWTLLHGIIFTSLVGYDYYTDGLHIVDYPSESMRIIDLMLGYIVVIVFMFMTFRLIRRNHEKQSNKIEEQRKELEISKTNLEASNIKLTKLLSVLAHDVRNPLASIQSFLELLESGDEFSEEEKEMIMSDLLKMVKGTSTMLDDMVNWTKLQIKGDGAHFELNSLSDWLDKTINNLNEIAKTKGVRLKTSYDPSQKLYCDSILMTVVIRNIIQNAIKFTPSGKSISFEVTKKRHSMVFVIADEGVGMSQEDVAKLFSSKSSSKLGVRKEVGTGLGLLIVKEYVNAHEGKIEINSALGKGTKFSIFIPTDMN